MMYSNSMREQQRKVTSWVVDTDKTGRKKQTA